MRTTPHDTRLTYDDFLQLPDDGLRHEIIDGEHYVTPSPNLRHQDLVLRLAVSLSNHLDDRPDRGRVFVAPFDVVFSFHDVVEPDVIFVAPDQLDVVTVHRRSAGGGFPTVASLSVERHDTLTTPLLPGWSLELERLFR